MSGDLFLLHVCTNLTATLPGKHAYNDNFNAMKGPQGFPASAESTKSKCGKVEAMMLLHVNAVKNSKPNSQLLKDNDPLRNRLGGYWPT